jgi:hypothetical protein
MRVVCDICAIQVRSAQVIEIPSAAKAALAIDRLRRD